MKFVTGALVGEMSGALGPVVASRGPYGTYFRSRVIPTKVVNDYTNAARGRLASLSQDWGALTAVQKEAWATWAATNKVTDRLGAQRVLQPSAAFIQLNARILMCGGSQISIPPVATPPTALTSLTVAADASDSTVTVTYTATPLGAGLKAAIWVAVVNSAGRKYYRNLLKLVAHTSAAQASPYAAGADVEARFGDLIEGQTIHCEVEIWDPATGLVSGRLYDSCVVAA
jgi:hypothetical protein